MKFYHYWYIFITIECEIRRETVGNEKLCFYSLSVFFSSLYLIYDTSFCLRGAKISIRASYDLNVDELLFLYLPFKK